MNNIASNLPKASLRDEKKGLPAALWALTITAFGIGTTEFVIVGLLPTVAKDLAISIPSAGLLVSLYAIGVAIGAPILTALTSRFPRKPLLISIVLLFIIGNIFATLAPGFITLVIARVLTGFAHGIYFSIGSTIAASLVKEEKRATAISIMFAGLTLAIVTGVPLGTFIGQHFGWRATFVGVSILGIIGLVSSVMLLPNTLKNAKGIALTAQLKVLTNKKLILAFLMTAMGYGGTFVVFTYLSPILQEITGLQESTVTVILLIYGIAIAIGNLVGGKIANKAPLKALFWMFIIQALVLFVFYFTVSNTVLSIITLFLIGLLSFATVPGLQLLVVQIAEKELPGTEDVASAINIAAFNIGIAIGSYAGGLVVTSSLGLQSTPWIGTLFLIGAVLLTFYSIRLNRGR
ncbi:MULTISPECIES: MFS transporter [unclassified Sphingobacterium]|uniref:MFS transporter n=1 Tax=unclassified Sphingobacterium TaxID=2609468 RepID=UPI001050B26A|nr:MULTISPECIES: MFS transporter [unclassified Sphingobacterium]MCS3557518.1 multidrug resistance protein [Sphingobacterium sp. JUb21]TCQ95904.1 multidrug resistance protein [Sphingobacterium sp. JUb20]